MDDDYYVVRGAAGDAGMVRKASFGIALALIGAAFAAAAVGLRQEGSGAELERQVLIDDVMESQVDLDRSRAIAAQLRSEVRSMERARGIDVPDIGDLGVVTGEQSASGPGVVARVDNGPGVDGLVADTDLQLLVNGLWYAGAEAVSVDGERIGSLTSIRAAGDAITVNFRSIRVPYDVVALGDPEALLTRFSQSPTGQYWEARHRQAKVRFDMKASTDSVVPAVPQRRLETTHARLLSGVGQEGEGS